MNPDLARCAAEIAEVPALDVPGWIAAMAEADWRIEAQLIKETLHADSS